MEAGIIWQIPLFFETPCTFWVHKLLRNVPPQNNEILDFCRSEMFWHLCKFYCYSAYSVIFQISMNTFNPNVDNFLSHNVRILCISITLRRNFITVIWQEEGYRAKYSLGTRKILRVKYCTKRTKIQVLFSFQIFQGTWFGGRGSLEYCNKYTFQHKLFQLQSMWKLFSCYREMRSAVEFSWKVYKISRIICLRNRVARNSQ